MNSYKFADLAVGMTESFEVEITENMMDKFIDITGDVSPIHVSREYAVHCGHWFLPLALPGNTSLPNQPTIQFPF